ncbi:MAG TPA: hypothetical protein VK195_10615 [Burkholderiaceae bacterium]|nr:hypothetical protein [Burkholderiaceae bacterium]
MPSRLPDPAEAVRQGPAQGEVTVMEPHLSRPGQAPVLVRYRGWPARVFLDRWLGKGWDRNREQGDGELEFRALDGFVSRIPLERFRRHQAWVVTARVDGQPFQVDNHAQGEKQVPLGPYYLIWDNLVEPALQAEGGAVWPYQVASVRRTPSSRAALLPGAMAPRYAAQAQALQTHCLSCHQVNGYGGDKMPINLALRAREIDAARWQQWLLQPARLKPGTTMPPLSEGLPLAEREALAQQLHEYLKALPLQP